jgi:RNA polymerase sigma-70 factor (ECF subfamily)
MYLRRPGSPTYEPFAMDVLRLEDGLVAEIITFGSNVFEWFGLPPQLEPR